MSIFSRNNDRMLGSPVTDHRTPLHILAERYARGEIGREEFQQIRRDLVEQEAMAGKAAAADTAATIGSLALINTATPEASLLNVVSGYVAANRGTEPSRILAGLIRALYLDGSGFQFERLEQLDPERRAWAEGLINAKIEQLLPLPEWKLAFEIVRHYERHADTAGPSLLENPPADGDWETLLREAEGFLRDAKSKGAASTNKAVEDLPDAVPADRPLVDASAAMASPLKVAIPADPAIADAPVLYTAMPLAEKHAGKIASPRVAMERSVALRYGVAVLIIVAIAAVPFNALWQKTPAKAPATAAARPAPVVADGGHSLQQQSGQIGATAPANAVTTLPAINKQALPAEPAKPLPAVVTPVATEVPEKATANEPPKSSATAAAPAPTNRKAAEQPLKVAPPTHPAPSRATVEPKVTTPPPAAPVVASPPPANATQAAATPPSDAPPKPPVQVAAVVPTLPRLTPEQRPAPRPDEIETWSGGEDALQQGMRNYQSGNYKDAAENLQKAIEAGLRFKRNAVTAHKFLALSHCALGRESECRQEFRQALIIDPSLTLRPEEAAVPSVGATFGSAKAPTDGK